MEMFIDFIEQICGECKYYSDECICTNSESDKCGCETDYEDACGEWEVSE